MSERDYPAVHAMLERYRAAVASQDAPPGLRDVASTLTGVLIEAWPRLTATQRQALSAVVATVELYGGGNTAYELVQEAVEARAMQQAGEALQRVSKAEPGASGGQ